MLLLPKIHIDKKKRKSSYITSDDDGSSTPKPIQLETPSTSPKTSNPFMVADLSKQDVIVKSTLTMTRMKRKPTEIKSGMNQNLQGNVVQMICY